MKYPQQRNRDIKQVIEEAKCGVCGPAENADIFSENILKFIKIGHKTSMALMARMFYEKNFTKNLFMEQLQNQL